jgi:hypothetical protein
MPIAGTHARDRRAQPVRRAGRVLGGADRQAVPVGPETGRGGEVQLGSGGVDEVVVAQPRGLADPARVGVGVTTTTS